MMENDAGIGWDAWDMSLFLAPALTWLEVVGEENCISDASLVIDSGSALNSAETLNTILYPYTTT